MSKDALIKMLRPLVLAGLLGTGAWMAPGTAADYATASGKLPNSEVLRMMESLRASIHHVQLPDGSSIAAETAEERKTPLVSVEEAKGFVDLGAVSALAKVCGLDWQRTNFIPMLENEQAHAQRTAKALAYIAALHGFGMGLMEDTYRKQGCSDETKPQVEARIAHRWR